MWPRICPVCRRELPERGNRRVYVSWKRGFRLVHAGECFEAIDAQGVLDTSPPPRMGDERLTALARRKVALLLDQPAQHTLEDLFAFARRAVEALQNQELSRDEAAEELHHSPEYLRQLVDRVLAHPREVCDPSRMEVPF